MRINIDSDDGDLEEVSVIHINGVEVVFGALNATRKALIEGYFYGSAQELDKLFTDFGGCFIDMYEEPGNKTFFFRPGVSEILDRIRIGATKVGGGPEVKAAFKTLVSITQANPIIEKMN